MLPILQLLAPDVLYYTNTNNNTLTHIIKFFHMHERSIRKIESTVKFVCHNVSRSMYTRWLKLVSQILQQKMLVIGP